MVQVSYTHSTAELPPLPILRKFHFFPENPIIFQKNQFAYVVDIFNWEVNAKKRMRWVDDFP